MRLSLGRKAALRFLGLLCATQVLTFLTYNLPQGYILGAHSGTWPASVQRLSYFSVGLCGEETAARCPRNGVPLTSDNYASRRPGERTVRLIHGDGGASPFSGTLLGTTK
jgi:hypothetical protein